MRFPFLSIVAAAFLAASASATERPDIVIFLADDLSWSDVSIHGGKDTPTPNVDRLAAAGMTFTHAFVASPSCAPSRAALLTGLDPMRNGAMLNHSRPRPGTRLWPAYFQEIGYEVVAFGKVAHYAQVRDYGFDHASHFNYHQDDCIEAAVQWLAERKAGQPLCLLVGTNWPHVPWPRATDADPDRLQPPPTLLDTPATRLARARYAAAVANFDRDLGLVYDAVRRHLGEATMFVFTADHGAQFPFGKWNCYDDGVRTPLVVAWPGRIEPGATSAALVSWIDLLPTLLEAAGGPRPQGISGRSFLPVLRGDRNDHRDQVFVTHSGDGEMNRYPIRAVRTRNWKYIRNLDSSAEHHTHIDKAAAGDGRDYWESWVERAMADPAAAAIVRRYHVRPPEELYDVRNDPWELNNLVADPDHASTLFMLRQELDAWMAEQRDEGLKTERSLPDPRVKKKKENS
jgi:N-sulfoglucosamine sulfohydrolase